MKQANGTFDFTAQDSLGVPAELVSIEADLRCFVRDAVDGLSLGVVAALDDRLRRTLDAWISGLEPDTSSGPTSYARVHAAFDALLAAYRCVTPASTAVDVARARTAADLVFWACAAQHSVVDGVWSELIEGFETAASGMVRVSGDLPGIGRQYLRALAFEVAAVDQLQGAALVAAAHLVDLAVPFLSLARMQSSDAVYSVDARRAGRPLRFVAHPAPSAWFFLSGDAVVFLTGLLARMQNGMVPPSLRNAGLTAGAAQTAARHLIVRWSSSPPLRRFRRHFVSGVLSVIRGLGEIRHALGGTASAVPVEWAISDLSRGGVGAKVAPDSVSIPIRGELLSFRPQDGASWHLGVVRRVRYLNGEVAIGIETLSPRPTLVRVDDGRAPHEVFFCDPVQKGEAVRVAAPVNTLRAGVPLFISADNRLQKLKPLEACEVDAGFELRVYQVL